MQPPVFTPPVGRPTWLAAVLCTALLSGCAPGARPLAQPDTALPGQWPDDSPVGSTAAADAVLPDWRAMVQDPTLAQLLEQSLAHNHDLRLALLRVEEARAAHGIQRADRFPSLAVGSNHARARVPGDLNVSGRPVTGSDHEVFVGLNSWELDLWGRVRSLDEAALQQYLATAAGARATQLSLLGQVARSYLALRELDERLRLARSTVESRAETLRIFTRRYEVGSISRYALTQVQSLHNQALSLAVSLEQERAQIAHSLAQLTGQPVAQLAELPALPAGASVFRAVPVGLPSALLQARPDIVAAEYQLQAAHAQVAAARAAFFPRIALTGSFGTASAQLDGLFGSGSQAWTFSPSISLPIFDGGRRSANLDLAAVRQHSAVASYERSVQTAFREVSDALSARHHLARQTQVQRDNLQVLQERARLAQLRYDNGASPYLDVLDAQRDLLTAAQQAVQAHYALQTAQVSLYTALGGAPAPVNP
ncbi:efflux transporter outer membrane subunit [Comamonas sp. UBA7528]|uniref:efflux transporter outer membrane subunit n=1 Tax=Comamonas sp. UBA7528 TaxID=1946391 RepID=UPI001B547093|nr:efflux transporter outer membrane subunit [Comamonas sp.]